MVKMNGKKMLHTHILLQAPEMFAYGVKILPFVMFVCVCVFFFVSIHNMYTHI